MVRRVREVERTAQAKRPLVEQLPTYTPLGSNPVVSCIDDGQLESAWLEPNGLYWNVETGAETFVVPVGPKVPAARLS